MLLKAIVIEDIPAIREAVIYRVNEHPELQVIEQFESVQATEDYLLDGGQADVLFLDVKLFGDYGWEILRTLRRESQKIPPVIVITAEDEKGYAQTVFREFNDEVVDYIVKPFEVTWADRRNECVRRVKACLEAQRTLQPRLNRLEISRGSTLAYVPVEEITCLLKTEKGIEVYFADEQQRYVDPYGAVGRYKQDIQRDNFVQVHRNALVNIDYVHSVRKHGAKGTALVTAGAVREVECSQEGVKSLRGKLRWG